MKCFIVLIPVAFSGLDSRPACEDIQGGVYTVSDYPCESIIARDIQKFVCGELKIDVSDEIEVEPITDFMDRVNNEEFDEANYFMSYVYADCKPLDGQAV